MSDILYIESEKCEKLDPEKYAELIIKECTDTCWVIPVHISAPSLKVGYDTPTALVQRELIQISGGKTHVSAK